MVAILSAYTGSSATVIGPSGDTTGATDVARINAGLANGGSVQLAAAPLSAPYYINAPITPTSQSRLWGAQWWSASDDDNYGASSGESGGTVIVMTPGFTGSAAILMSNPTAGQYYGVDLAGFTIEGHDLSSGTIYGILVDGAWGAGFIRGVCVHRPPADCLRFQIDATSFNSPDDWQVINCKFSGSRNGNGAYMGQLDDSWFSDCEMSENALDGWYAAFAGGNTRVTTCKAENNGGNGFRGGGIYANQAIYFTGCSTHLNQKNGFLFDNSGGGGQLGSYLLAGCVAQLDGQASASGGYAGFAVSACASRVGITGGAAISDGTYPQYGASQVSSSYATCLTGVFTAGGTAPVHDDGSNASALVNQVPAFGTTPAMVVQAATAAAGYTLVNGTGAVVSWTAPNDGNVHRFCLIWTLLVTSGETGGQITIGYTDPAGNSRTFTVIAAGQSAAYYSTNTTQTPFEAQVKANTTVTVRQNSALTGGAATLWADIMGC